MTPEQRAKKLVDSPEWFYEHESWPLIALAISEAIAEERERCAAIAKEVALGQPASKGFVRGALHAARAIQGEVK